jgi:hypothetical protein
MTDVTPIKLNRLFISSAATTNLQPLGPLLAEAHLEATSWHDISSTFVGGFREAIAASAGVLAFLDDPNPNPAVIFELGMAVGLGRPVVLVVQNHEVLRDLPMVLRSLPTLILSEHPAKSAALRLVSLLESSTGYVTNEWHSITSFPYARPEVVQREWADEYEAAVARELKRIGANVVGQVPANRRGYADLAAWMPGLPIPDVNPLLVEVAGSGAVVSQKVAQLKSYLEKSGLRFGLLVTRENQDIRWDYDNGTAVLVIGLDQLRVFSSNDLRDSIIRARNVLAHR